MNAPLHLPTPSRALGVAFITALITSLAMYGAFTETDHGQALFFTYEEVWDAAERQQASGKLREAERLIRHIVATEENRVTLKFGFVVGPGYLVNAKLKLAELLWRQGRLQDADAGYRDALVTVASLSGTTHWRYAVAHFSYAEFLADTGRFAEARQKLTQTEELIRSNYREWSEDDGSTRGENEEAKRRPRLADLSRKISALRDRHAAM